MKYNFHLTLIWLLIINCLAIYLFFSGFFLTRYELENKSGCMDKVSPHYQPPNSSHQPFQGRDEEKGCWIDHTKFKKAIIIVIDALRIDFATFDHQNSSDQESQKPYKNKLKILDQLLHQRPQNSILFRFISDAPTTTMQRLKVTCLFFFFVFVFVFVFSSFFLTFFF